MEDLRDAEHTVATFAKLIDRLRPDNISRTRENAGLLAKRQNSNGSQKSAAPLSARWRSKKKEWDESVEGILWNELEQPQSEVAQSFSIDPTALKEFISSPEMMKLGCEFARHYDHEDSARQEYWTAEDLFFELQAVKQGDGDPGRWVGPKVYKKDWDIADHLVRFVLLAEQCRLCSGQGKWTGWEWGFSIKVAFYLSILRCYTIREAKQKELAKNLTGVGSSGNSATSPRSSHGSRNSRQE